MRSALGIVLGLVLTGVVAAAEKRVPQDPARQERRRQALREWNLRTTQGAYDRVGKKDPRWDRPAREALAAAAGMYSQQVDPEVRYDDIHRPAQEAVDAGCDDPLVLYVYERSLVGPNYRGQEETIRRSETWSKALAASRYPAFRRALALQYAASYHLGAKELDEAARKEAERGFDAALALLPESIDGDERNEFWEGKWFNVCNDSIAGFRKLGLEPKAAYERVDAALARRPEVKVLRLWVRGNFWLHYGWEARTDAFAAFVPRGGFETLEARLDIADKALREAWDLGRDDLRTSTDAQIAQLLISIDKGVRGDREQMELWFDRAMKADGDCYLACWNKLDWLDPKWYGTVEEMVAFGLACRDTRNWRAEITLLCADAHFRYGGKLDPDERLKYMKRPAVWDDVRSVYAEYLPHRPEDHVRRTKFAVLSYLGGHYIVANAQFRRLGENLTAWGDAPFFPYKSIEEMRDRAAQIAAANPQAKAVKKKQARP